jgi:hypothetical protein
MAQLFGDHRCTPAILEFLAQTEVGVTGRYRQGASGKTGEARRTGGATWRKMEMTVGRNTGMEE